MPFWADELIIFRNILKATFFWAVGEIDRGDKALYS
jgi:hypothetical protein